jgi:hypothetical protein
VHAETGGETDSTGHVVGALVVPPIDEEVEGEEVGRLDNINEARWIGFLKSGRDGFRAPFLEERRERSV